MSEPSDHFSKAFGSGVGSPHLQCQCGRWHYAPDGDFVGDDERDEMIDHHKESPDKVVLHMNDDAVSAAIVNGVTAVRGCSCGWLAKFEEFVWNERKRIIDYYKMRRDAEASATASLDQL